MTFPAHSPKGSGGDEVRQTDVYIRTIVYHLYNHFNDLLTQCIFCDLICFILLRTPGGASL